MDIILGILSILLIIILYKYYYQNKKITKILDKTLDLLDNFYLAKKLEIELRESNNKLQQSEERYRTMAEFSPYIIIIHIDNKIVYANPAAVKFFKIEKEMLINSYIFDRIHPDYYEIVKLRIHDSIEKNESAPVIELKYIDIYGETLYADVQGLPIIYNGVPAIYVTMKDTTEDKVLLDELQENKQKYFALSEAAFESIFFSENGICIEQNKMAEKMFGYTTEEAIGRFGTDWIVPEYRDIVMNNMLTEYEEPYEAVAIRKDGSTFPCLLKGKMMHYKQKNIRVTSLSELHKIS
jgi:PAS domain S-box-containing protein